MDEKKKKQKTIIIVAVAAVLALVIILSIALPLTIGKSTAHKVAFTVDGVVVKTIDVGGKNTPVLPEPPTKVGYTFGGWFFDKDTLSDPCTVETLEKKKLTADISVYAKWTKVSYTITYNKLDGATNTNPGGYSVDTPTIILGNLTHTDVDKKFLGWYDQPVDGKKITEIAIGSSGNIILFARWQAPTAGLKYTLINAEMEYSVAKTNDKLKGDIIIPSKYNGKPVTAIAVAAFANCAGITSVIIPTSVTSIGFGAFANCTGITSVSIPDSVTDIDRSVFLENTSLTSIVLPKNLKIISDDLFSKCAALTSIIIPEGVAQIGLNAFSECKSLTSIVLPLGVKRIDNNAFASCVSLTSIFIPKTVDYIGNSVFMECKKLTIKCEVQEVNKPANWNLNWSFGAKETLWGQTK